MTEAEILDLRKQIAKHYEDEEHEAIDDDLRAFGIRSDRDWPYSGYRYVMDSTDDVDRESLLSLASYLGFSSESASISGQESIWRGSGLRVFISHSSADKAIVAELAALLKRQNYSPFVAHEDIEPNAAWQSVLVDALKTCDVVVALVSESFLASSWCQQEIGWAMGRGVPVHCIKYGAVPEAFAGTKQAATPKSLEAQEIYRAVAGRLKESSAKKGSRELLRQLIHSRSYAMSNELIREIVHNGKWNAEYTRLFERAYEQNDQVSEAFAVSEHLLPFTKKHGYQIKVRKSEESVV